MRYDYEEREEAGATTKLTYLLIGTGVGAALALLFAPKSGQELRGDIADVTRKGVEKSKETASLVGERAGEYYEVSREKAGELYSTAQEKVGNAYEAAQEKVGELYSTAAEKAESVGEKAKEKALETAERTSNPFSAAIEAGKEAYEEEKRRTATNNPLTEGRPNYPITEKKVLDVPTVNTDDGKLLDIPKENI